MTCCLNCLSAAVWDSNPLPPLFRSPVHCTADPLKCLDVLLSGDENLIIPSAHCWVWMYTQYWGVKTQTEELLYKDRSYIFGEKMASHSKHFLKLKNMAKGCGCSVLSFLGLLCYLSPRQSCSWVTHRMIRGTFMFICLL